MISGFYTLFHSSVADDVYNNIPVDDVACVDGNTGIVYTGEIGGYLSLRDEVRVHLIESKADRLARATRKMLRVRK